MDAAERAARMMLGDLDVPEQGIRDLLHDLLTDARLSDGERVVVDVATTFWSGGGSATLGSILSWLDRDNLGRFAQALAILRPDVFVRERSDA